MPEFCFGQVRHGGESADLLAKRRSYPEVQRRERWASEKSMTRCGKPRRVMQMEAALPKEVRAYGLRGLTHFPEVFRDGRSFSFPKVDEK